MNIFEEPRPASQGMTVAEAEWIQWNTRDTPQEIPYPVSADATRIRDWTLDNLEF